jgi:hypothetical protein
MKNTLKGKGFLMSAVPGSPRAEQPQDQRSHLRPMLCPLCNGVLCEMRGTLRCGRCYFSVCEACEGGAAENSLDWLDS